MKTQFKKNKTVFNFRVNEQEYEIVKILREKHAINISGAFKIFLKELLGKMERK